MLAKFSSSVFSENQIFFGKSVKGEDASLFGAFSLKTVICLSLKISRKCGFTGAFLRINRDGCESELIQLQFKTTHLGFDTYSAELDLEKLCKGSESGLFYYDFLILRGEETFYSDTYDNLNISICGEEGGKFRLLVYKEAFDTPTWFHGGIMYQIFVDRFCKGSFEPICRPDAEMNNDWDNGVPQFAEYPGAFVRNNQFFGGNLIGLAEKLDYLSELGVSVIYLCPIFKAYSNHKYDTGDYMQVDEMFGGDKALEELIHKAGKKGIKIILDGVFNHTGDDSIYFNKYGKYDSIGAYQSKDSMYSDWFSFKSFPDEYESWWGIPILPKLNLTNKDCLSYLVEGENSVVGKYTKMGIGGIRLDVADELTNDFLDKLRVTAKDISKGEAVIIGEVWENAADKIAYGHRRRYLQGAQLDSVMNYPFRSASLEYLLSGDSSILANELTELYSSYPKCVCDSLMNILGTHDTERILSVLCGENKYDLPNCELAYHRMSEDAKKRAIKLLKLGSVLQYTVYGVPSVFYGDEAGIEGYRDPFCRMPFPWGRENKEILDHYKLLGKIRRENSVFKDGLFRITAAKDAYLEYERRTDKELIKIAINAGDTPIHAGLYGKDLISGKEYSEDDLLFPYTAVIIK